MDIDASVSVLKYDKKARELDPKLGGGCMYEMGSYPLLPIFKLLGTDYKSLQLYSKMDGGVDVYTRGFIRYDNSTCSFKLGMNVKRRVILLFQEQKDMPMFLHHGGKWTIMSFAMKIKMIIRNSSINLMVKDYVMRYRNLYHV